MAHALKQADHGNKSRTGAEQIPLTGKSWEQNALKLDHDGEVITAYPTGLKEFLQTSIQVDTRSLLGDCGNMYRIDDHEFLVFQDQARIIAKRWEIDSQKNHG